MSHAVEAIGIHKTFRKHRTIREIVRHPFERAGTVRALRGIDLAVREGETLSLLGPNGAGKTTLLKIFSCLVLPDVGQALIHGTGTDREYAVKKMIGLVNSDERSFYWRLSARENLRFFARLYDVPSRRIESRIDELLGRVDLLADADRPFAHYSSGMKQRVAIVRALLHDPIVLLMDEPTRSLDPVSSLALRDFIQTELKQRDGKTIVLATHNLHEAAALSDRVAIIARGRLRQLGTVDEIRRWGLDEHRFRLEMEPDGRPLHGPFRIIEDGVHEGIRTVTVGLEPGVRLDGALRELIGVGVSLHACDRIEPDLEEAFSRIVDADDDPDAESEVPA